MGRACSLPQRPTGVNKFPEPRFRQVSRGTCSSAGRAGALTPSGAQPRVAFGKALPPLDFREFLRLARKAWSGRFQGGTDPRIEKFTESVTFDRRLYAHDIAASVAHAEMLAEAGLLKPSERARIVEALEAIRGEIEAGTFAFRTELEDVHMNIEAALIERLGDVGRKLHTARSRNDQVATDLKLWVRDGIDRVDELLAGLQRAFVDRGEHDAGVILPGYTHLQRAQPVPAVHYWLAYCERLQRDRDRLADCRRRVNVLPLGTAAVAGTSLPIDREYARKKLGFDAVASNSLDAAGDRDFVMEFVFCLAMVAEHLSGWAEEWILWSTTEFGFLALPDAYATGSSIMPQKKNPDVLELIRGKTARVVGGLQSLLVLVKGLPLAYNRDLQEDKPPLFDAYDTVTACLELAAAVVAAAQLRREAIAARLEEGFLDATALMEYLVDKGAAMRSAHEVVGKLVRVCEERGCRLAELPLVDFQSVEPRIGGDVFSVLGVENAVKVLKSIGSASPEQVWEQLQRWQERLATKPDG